MTATWNPTLPVPRREATALATTAESWLEAEAVAARVVEVETIARQVPLIEATIGAPRRAMVSLPKASQ